VLVFPSHYSALPTVSAWFRVLTVDDLPLR